MRYNLKSACKLFSIFFFFLLFYMLIFHDRPWLLLVMQNISVWFRTGTWHIHLYYSNERFSFGEKKNYFQLFRAAVFSVTNLYPEAFANIHPCESDLWEVIQPLCPWVSEFIDNFPLKKNQTKLRITSFNMMETAKDKCCFGESSWRWKRPVQKGQIPLKVFGLCGFRCSCQST